MPDYLISGYWQSYMQTYIERDVRKVANIGSLFKSRFPGENIHPGFVICAIPVVQKLSDDVVAIPWWYL